MRKELILEERTGIQEAMMSRTIGKHMGNMNNCLWQSKQNKMGMKLK